MQPQQPTMASLTMKITLPMFCLLSCAVGCETKTDDTDTDTDTDTSTASDTNTTTDPNTDTGTGTDTNTDTDTDAVVLYINEFMASNLSTTFKGDDQSTPDWIELYNPGEEIDLTGYTITDDLEEPNKHILGDLSVPSGGYLLLFADSDPEKGPDHLEFKLSREEESIGLYTPDGTALDLVNFTDQASDASSARIPDGGQFQIRDDPTPGATNPKK